MVDVFSAGKLMVLVTIISKVHFPKVTRSIHLLSYNLEDFTGESHIRSHKMQFLIKILSFLRMAVSWAKLWDYREV